VYRLAERRARFQPCWGRCYGALAAAGAASAEQPHPRHVRTHRRHLDPVVDHLRGLQFAWPGSVGVRAIVETRIDNAVRVWLQRAGHTKTPLARRLVASLPIRLLALRRRQRRGGSDELSGVFRGRSSSASRTSSAAMRASATSNCPTAPPTVQQEQQRTDQRILLGMAQLAEIDVGHHADVESAAHDRVNRHSKPSSRRRNTKPATTQVSNYPDRVALVCDEDRRREAGASHSGDRNGARWAVAACSGASERDGPANAARLGASLQHTRYRGIERCPPLRTPCGIVGAADGRVKGLGPCRARSGVRRRDALALRGPALGDPAALRRSAARAHSWR